MNHSFGIPHLQRGVSPGPDQLDHVVDAVVDGDGGLADRKGGAADFVVGSNVSLDLQ